MRTRRLRCLTAGMIACAVVCIGLAGAQMARAADPVTVRLRPTAIPFVLPGGEKIHRIIDFYITLQADSVREICRRRAEIKNAFLVTAYNHRLAEKAGELDIAALGRELYGAYAGLFGDENVLAVHLAISGKAEKAQQSEIQKRLEQLEDCTVVKKLPGGVMTVRSAAPPPAAKAMKPIPPPPDPTAGTRAPITAPATAAQPGGCNLELRNLWPGGWVVIDGDRYWMARATTVDKDGDLRPEDVQFLLKRKSGGDLDALYFDLHGEDQTRRFEGLTIAEPGRIAALCPGSQDFDPPAGLWAADVKSNAPSLESEVKGRIMGFGKPPADDRAVVVRPVDFWRWVAAAVALGAAFLAAAVLLLFMLHVRADRRRRADRREKNRRKSQDRRVKSSKRDPDRRKKADRRKDADRRSEARRQNPDRRS